VFSPRRHEDHEELNTKKRLKEGKDRRSEKENYRFVCETLFLAQRLKEDTEGHGEKMRNRQWAVILNL
jgi:hypothetical protein